MTRNARRGIPRRDQAQKGHAGPFESHLLLTSSHAADCPGSTDVTSGSRGLGEWEGLLFHRGSQSFYYESWNMNRASQVLTAGLRGPSVPPCTWVLKTFALPPSVWSPTSTSSSRIGQVSFSRGFWVYVSIIANLGLGICISFSPFCLVGPQTTKSHPFPMTFRCLKRGFMSYLRHLFPGRQKHP